MREAPEFGLSDWMSMVALAGVGVVLPRYAEMCSTRPPFQTNS
jgi:hypothetical protein